MLRQLILATALMAVVPPLALSADAARPWRAVSFVPSATAPTRMSDETMNLVMDNMKMKANSACWENPSELHSCPNDRCEAVYQSVKAMALAIGPYNLEIKPGSLFMLKHIGHAVIVYNLHDRSPKSIVVHSAGPDVDVEVGKSLRLDLNETTCNSDSLPFPWIAEIRRSALLKEIRTSNESEDRRFWQRILKTAVAVQKVHGYNDLEYLYRNAEAYNKASLKVR